jgi:hypothetical protein
MQDEVAGGWLGPAGLVMTASQAKGAFFGTASVGAVFGLAVGLAWAYAMDSTFSRPARIILGIFLGVVGGGTVGFLAGGIHTHRQEAAGDPERPQDDRRMATASAVCGSGCFGAGRRGRSSSRLLGHSTGARSSWERRTTPAGIACSSRVFSARTPIRFVVAMRRR